MNQREHNQTIVNQFTRQAAPFASKMSGRTQEDSLKLLLEISGVSASDEVLDVACGPGIVACAFAAAAHHVTGIDLTPAMLERAKALQQERGLTNLTWRLGEAAPLPFPNDAFSLVLTRYSFHHFLSPAAVLAEMVRVCKPGGRVMVVDVTPGAEKLAGFDEFEKLRDPSHAHALSREQLHALFSSAGLQDLRVGSYELEFELERQLSASFPNPGDADRIRRFVQEDVGRDQLGVNAHLQGGEVYLVYPVTVIVGAVAG